MEQWATDQAERDRNLVQAAAVTEQQALSNERGRSDEGDGIATYYRGAYFPLCEMCNKRPPIDGIVCARCAPRVDPVPEAAMRDPDVSDVARVLREMGRL